MPSGKEYKDFWLITISGWFVRYLAGLCLIWLGCRWFVGGMAGLWLICGFGLFVDGLVCVCVRVCVCVCVAGGVGGSSGVLVSKRAVLSYQNYIIFVSKQELF